MPYTTIPDAEIDPDSPVTASLMQKMRDNPVGIANADAGAPKIRLAALLSKPIKKTYLTFTLGSGSITQTQTAAAFADSFDGACSLEFTATVVSASGQIFSCDVYTCGELKGALGDPTYPDAHAETISGIGAYTNQPITVSISKNNSSGTYIVSVVATCYAMNVFS
jgi:hypothetical protein